MSSLWEREKGKRRHASKTRLPDECVVEGSDSKRCKKVFERDQQVKPESSTPSCLSMKSDRSINEPPYFSQEPLRNEKRTQQIGPSCQSMKTDHSDLERLNPHQKQQISDKRPSPQIKKNPDQCFTGPVDVACDFCTGRKLRAVTSCLTCPASLCENHVRQHYTIPALQRHTLVEMTRDLEQRLCQQHHRALEVFCKTDQTLICKVCAVEEHKDHSKFYKDLSSILDATSLMNVTLETMKKKHFSKFKRQLNEDYPECLGSQLEGLNVPGVVEKMVESFGEQGALRITLHFQDVGTPRKVRRSTKANLKKKCQYISEGLSKQGQITFLSEIYTELYITEGGSGDVNTEHEVRQVEMISKKQMIQDTPIKYNDIFKAPPGQRRQIRTVLTKGIAGIGKTVSVQKFILDWAEGKANQDIMSIVPLPFRDLNLKKENYSLIQLLHHYAPELKETKDIEDEKVKLLLIFDGLDECRFPLDFQGDELCRDVTESTSVDVLLINLIKGNLLPSALIWITSRPAAASQIPPECVHRVIEIRGFTDPQKEEYFWRRIRDSNLASRIVTHIKSSRSLHIMCHIPVFCWLSATVLETMMSDAGPGEIPRTLTEMYTHFLLIQMSLKNKKYHGTSVDNPKKLSQSDKEMIMKLGELAFQQLEKGNLIFYEEDLRKCGIDVSKASEYSSLCTEIFREELGLYRERVFCFVHLSIQEHLAAVYAHVSCVNENKNAFNALKCSQKREDKLRQLDQISRPSLSEPQRSAVVHIQPNESERTKQSESRLSHSGLRLNENTSLSNQHKEQTLEPKECNLSHDDVTFFPETPTRIKSQSADPTVRPQQHSSSHPDVHQIWPETSSNSNLAPSKLCPERQKMTTFDISATRLSFDEYLSPLFELHQSAVNKALESKNGHLDLFLRFLFGLSLDSSQCLLQDLMTGSNSEMRTYTRTETINEIKKKIGEESSPERIINLFHCLNELNDNSLVEEINAAFRSGTLSDKELQLDQCSALAFVLLMSEEVLDQFDLKLYKTSPAGRRRLLPVLRTCRRARLDHCHLSSESCLTVAAALQSMNSLLRELDLSYNDLTDAGVKVLMPGLMSPNSKLQKLRLAACNLSSDSCVTVASALQSVNSTLRTLDLSNNNLTDLGVKLLCTELMSPTCRLQELQLNVCSLTEDCCVDLASVLRFPHSDLRKLELRDNDLRDSGVELLSEGLADPCCKLEKLGLSGCGITEEGCASLASALGSNPSHLRELDLSYNHPGSLEEKLLHILLDPDFKLERLEIEHGEEGGMKPGLRKYSS